LVAFEALRTGIGAPIETVDRWCENDQRWYCCAGYWYCVEVRWAGCEDRLSDRIDAVGMEAQEDVIIGGKEGE